MAGKAAIVYHAYFSSMAIREFGADGYVRIVRMKLGTWVKPSRVAGSAPHKLDVSVLDDVPYAAAAGKLHTAIIRPYTTHAEPRYPLLPRFCRAAEQRRKHLL